MLIGARNYNRAWGTLPRDIERNSQKYQPKAKSQILPRILKFKSLTEILSFKKIPCKGMKFFTLNL